MNKPNLEVLPELEIVPSISFEKMHDNVQYAARLGLRSITDCSAWRTDNHIAIVGGGPSLEYNLDELRRYKYIMACGSVHDYLIRNGIYPNWCVIADPDEIMVDYLQERDCDVQYLIASQCHAKVFDHLKNYRTYLWHAGGSPEEDACVNFPTTDYIIGGGCTVGTRAIVIAINFGFTNHVLFGFDSCIIGDKHHSYDFVNPSKETLGDIFDIKVGNENSPTFKVAGYMVGQIRDFQKICEIYSKQVLFTIIGGGPLAEIINLACEQAKGI